MKVFISWSGESSHRIAELLRTYLPCIIQDLRPFVSSHDLASGERWSSQLTKELDESSFGIICLTPDNLHSDWILFEAGALTKHADGRACCLLLQALTPTDVAGPLAQFQNRLFNKSELRKLLGDLNRLLPLPLSDSALDMIFAKWWPDLENSVTSALASSSMITPPSKRETRDLLEELLERVRNMQQALEARIQLQPRPAPPRVKPDIIDLTLKSMVGALTPEQQLLLSEFVTPEGSLRYVNIDSLRNDYSQADIDAVMQCGLVANHGSAFSLIHDMLIPYVSKYLRTAPEPGTA